MIILQTTPDLIKIQSNEVQLIYFFGSIIVTGLVAALAYLRSEIKKRDKVIEQKNKEIKEILAESYESDKANLIVLKDVVSILEEHKDILKDISNKIQL